MHTQRRIYRGLGLLLALVAAACERAAPSPPPAAPSPVQPKVIEPRALENPVPLWENGTITGQIDASAAATKGYVVVDLGEVWTPYIFTEGQSDDGQPLANSYRATYLQLARGEFGDDYVGERARRDKYLELYGIMPTLAWLRERMQTLGGRACLETLDLSPLAEVESVDAHPTARAAARSAQEHTRLRAALTALAQRHAVATIEDIDPERLRTRELQSLQRYFALAAAHRAVEAAQQRLACEGFLPPDAAVTRGVLDPRTRQALMEFERRHRIHGWGQLSADTLAVLRTPPLQAELQGLLRVLTERAIHAAGVLEDGSTNTLPDGRPRTFTGADGKTHPLPNLVAELQQRVIDAFGLQTPQSALRFLASLGQLPPGEHRFVALSGPTLPEYYARDMDMRLEIDRGDVWYEFPFDEQGRKVSQPVERRPHVTVSIRYLGQSIPIARYPTTIGGWRSKQIGDTLMWRYQESPVGERVWNEIVAAPVWLPPDTTPPKALLKRKKKVKFLEPPYEVNYYTTGPGYASAFGLVAAYHNRFAERSDGTIRTGYDEGIRTHGSVDYMSIMRRQSNGCHRLHNHVAVRLMSWVLAHRAHQRKGQLPVAFKKVLQYEEHSYDLELTHGGYVFELNPPLAVEVLEGRIRGKLKEPIPFEIPMYDELRGAYVTSDGRAVRVQGAELVEVALPAAAAAEAGVAEAALSPAAPGTTPGVPADIVDIVADRPSYRPGPPPSPALSAKQLDKPES
jgi:hypothetical protein